MKWSWRMGRIAGITVNVHATFPLLFVWIALAQAGTGATTRSLLGDFALLLTAFGIVVLHELGHALTARRFGIRTLDITLLPIGGIARLERMPREPRQELLIALAGPAVNVALVLPLYVLLRLSGATTILQALSLDAGTAPAAWFIVRLLLLNVWLAVFNLIPAFPLDGGRVLRALLAMRTHDYATATMQAAKIGRLFALLFGLAGLFVLSSPGLVLIALFVWLAAASEASAVQTSVALEGVPLERLMITNLQTLAPTDTLAHAAQLTLDGFQQDFPVLDQGRLVGMLTRSDLIRGLNTVGNGGWVTAVMRREFPSASEADSPEEALRQLTRSGGGSLPVVRNGELLGVLTAENVMEFLMLRAAQDGERAP